MSLTDSETENTRTPYDGKKRGPKPQRVKKQAPHYTEEQIEAITGDLLVWVKDEKNQIFEAFFKKHSLAKTTWHEWKEKNPYVKWAHEVARTALASNTYEKTPECPSRGLHALKTQYGWTGIEEIMEVANKVMSYQELKAKIDGKV